MFVYTPATGQCMHGARVITLVSPSLVSRRRKAMVIQGANAVGSLGAGIAWIRVTLRTLPGHAEP